MVSKTGETPLFRVGWVTVGHQLLGALLEERCIQSRPRSLRMLACLRTSGPDKIARRDDSLPLTKIEKKYLVNTYPGAQTHKKIQGNMFTFYQDAKFVVAC